VTSGRLQTVLLHVRQQVKDDIRELCCMEGFADRGLSADRRNAREACGFLGWVIADLMCVYRERPKHSGPAGLGVMILP
jgi:hypothetical protein